MGYGMRMQDSTATIAVEDIPAAQDALLALSPGRYAWMSLDWQQSGDIVEMLREWRYTIAWDEYGGILIDNFEGEKYGDDPVLWRTLAPHMRGYITMMGEDGESWRWVFDGETLGTVPGRIVYE